MCVTSILASRGQSSPLHFSTLCMLPYNIGANRTPFTMGLKDMLIDSFSKAPSAVSSQYSDSFIDTFDSYLDPVLEVFLRFHEYSAVTTQCMQIGCTFKGIEHIIGIMYDSNLSRLQLSQEPQPVIDSICFLLDQKYPEMWTFPSTQSKLLR